LVAVLENHQNPDGSIAVPNALRPYLGDAERLEPVAS
jgi:seryl-tRNA synthetase